MKKKIGIIIGLIVLVLLIIGLVFAIRLVQEKQELRKQAATPGGTATISLTGPDSVTAGQTLPVTIAFQTPNTPSGKGIIGIKVVLNYTLSEAGVAAITKENIEEKLTSPWNYQPKEITTSGNTGTITINALYLQAGEYGYLGSQDTSQNLAVLNFTTSSNGTLSLTFDITKCEIWSKESNLDILGLETAGKTIIIGSGSTATITNTPTSPAGAATATPTTAAQTTASPTPTTANYGIGSTAPTNTPTPTKISSPTNTPTPTKIANATNTPTSTPTPTGSTGQVALTSITSGQTVTSTKPVFSGIAPPGSTVTITVYSDPLTATVVADSSGHWSWTPPEDLAPGNHTVTITATSTQGQTSTTTSSFKIGSLPQTGNFSLTFLVLASGLTIFLLAIWRNIQKTSLA